ncbi:MAG: hypothetical protein HY261_11000 [Chloroflexi bacterium]|nr:hypothetical protein [Chloroflexota bacterium]
MNKSNLARATSRVWWLLTLLFLSLTVVAFVIDMGDASYAIAFVSFFLFITAIIVAVIYGSRAGKLDRMLSGEGLLAHWTYSPGEWRQYAENEYRTEKSAKKLLFFIVSGFALIAGIVAVIVDRHAGIWVLFVMLALIAIIGFLAWFTTWHDYRQNLRYQGEAYISKDGIYLNRQLHLWNQLGAYLGSVEYIEENPPLLVFSYFAPTRTGMEQRDVRVPIPKGKEDNAKELLGKFQARLVKR